MKPRELWISRPEDTSYRDMKKEAPTDEWDKENYFLFREVLPAESIPNNSQKKSLTMGMNLEVSPYKCEHRMECRDCGAIPEETPVDPRLKLAVIAINKAQEILCRAVDDVDEQVFNALNRLQKSLDAIGTLDAQAVDAAVPEFPWLEFRDWKRAFKVREGATPEPMESAEWGYERGIEAARGKSQTKGE